MDYSDSYIDYLVYFHGQRDYFECHEVLEENWKKEGAIQNHYWIGLIQIAVALYHQRRGNFSGAEKMLRNAISNIEKNESNIEMLGLDSHQLKKMIEERFVRIKNKEAYESFNLPINDPNLKKICEDKCLENHHPYGSPSNMSDHFLIHKHKLRDRTEIIKERNARLKQKSKRMD